MIKILIGGSPCTYWSVAQKKGREVEAEGLGWELFRNYLIAKEKFIRLLLPFLVRLEKGKGIDNLRLNINEAWTVYKRNRREKGL